jgi:hypothetical protein
VGGSTESVSDVVGAGVEPAHLRNKSTIIRNDDNIRLSAGP